MSNKVEISIRVARSDETSTVIGIVNEAATWLVARGIPLWTAAELDPVQIGADVDEGYYVLALDAGSAVGVMRVTLEDPLFWPEALVGEASYVHRLAVRRTHAGRNVPATLLAWAGERAAELGRTWLRLDCEASRPQLRALYEGLGFAFHSEHTVGDLFVARYQRRVK